MSKSWNMVLSVEERSPLEYCAVPIEARVLFSRGQKQWYNNTIICDMCFDFDSTGIFVTDIDPTVKRIDAAEGTVTMELSLGFRFRMYAVNHATNSLIVMKSGRIVSVGLRTGEIFSSDIREVE
jgi:hypothetical protein